MWVVWLAAAVILAEAGYQMVKGFYSGFRDAREATSQPPVAQQPAPANPPPAEAKVTPTEAKVPSESAAKKSSEHPESAVSKAVPPPAPAPPAPVAENDLFPTAPGKSQIPKMTRQEFDKKFGEQIRQDVEKYRQQAEAMSATRKAAGAARRAQRPVLEPVPADRARLLVDATRIPTGLGLVVMMDGKQLFREAERRGSPESHWYHELIPPGTHELRAILGAGGVRLGLSNQFIGEFTAGQERTLRVELGVDRRPRPAAKGGERQSPTLEVRITVD